MLFTDNTNTIFDELLASKIVANWAELDAEYRHFKFVIIEFFKIVLRSHVDNLHGELVADSLEFAVGIEDN